MRDISYTSKLIYTENGKPLKLDYSILVSDSNGTEYYGVKIVEKNSGAQSLDFDLTIDIDRIYDLMDKLSRNNVTPTGVSDVLADWL